MKREYFMNIFFEKEKAKDFTTKILIFEYELFI